jgi:trehalose/maltose hydrolase-like predicted phosphorylase
LSARIHALVGARLGETETALRFLRQAAAADLELDPNSAGGIRIAGLGGLWQAIVLGFARLGLDGHYWPPPVVGALITTQRVLASGLP